MVCSWLVVLCSYYNIIFHDIGYVAVSLWQDGWRKSSAVQQHIGESLAVGSGVQISSQDCVKEDSIACANIVETIRGPACAEVNRRPWVYSVHLQVAIAVADNSVWNNPVWTLLIHDYCSLTLTVCNQRTKLLLIVSEHSINCLSLDTCTLKLNIALFKSFATVSTPPSRHTIRSSLATSLTRVDVPCLSFCLCCQFSGGA